MAVAEDLRPAAVATVAEVWGHSYGRRSYLYLSLVFHYAAATYP